MLVLVGIATAAAPTLLEAPGADRPPMVAGVAGCKATLSYDASGAITGVEVVDCNELFAASTRAAAEKVKLGGVTEAGTLALVYRFGEETGAEALVASTSPPVLGHPYDVQVAKREMPRWPKKATSGMGPARCVVNVKVDAEGLPNDLSVEGCPDVFHEAAMKALGKWRWKPIANPPEGGVPVKVVVVFKER